jgi:hypothetical protein
VVGEKMSHYSIYKTKLGNITEDFLKRAVTSLAEKIGADVVSAVKDFMGHSHNVTIALRNANCPNGIGFGVDAHGNLTVHGDAYGQELEFTRLQTLAQNYIKAYKVAQNTLALHPMAKIQTKILEKAVVMEVAV